VVRAQDLFDILCNPMNFRGELGDIYDFTVFELPGVRAKVAIITLAWASLGLGELAAHVI
jgi:hypothetical protein